MHDKARSYWKIGTHFLRLAEASCTQLVRTGNQWGVTSDGPLPPGGYKDKTLWSDHSVGIAILFNFFHGIELLLKGFLVASGPVPRHHRLTHLLKAFEQAHANTTIGDSIARNVRNVAPTTPLGKFIKDNAINIDDWYEALKYPESAKGKHFTHVALQYGDRDTLPFWRALGATARELEKEAVALARQLGLA